MRFTRGRSWPRAVAWFGIRSFWGHLRHFVASGIATENIDSRDWMSPDPPDELVERVARALGGLEAPSLSEALDDEIWIDFLADTGDDADVSRAVAEMVFAEYELPDPERPGRWIRAPRGDLLVFGGDTAYPVATAEEINNRVVVPFNQVLAQRNDGKARVLLGIPGNHDWYDGLDGFGRMFRRRPDAPSGASMRPSVVAVERRQLEHAADWAKGLMLGRMVKKLPALVLDGYTTVQNASYFALPLSEHVHLIAVDRQLKQIDFRQRVYFRDWLAQHRKVLPLVMIPDPVLQFGLESPSGRGAVSAIGLRLSAKPHLILSGDLHHYQRWSEGLSQHVVAGGGGAFLHPTGQRDLPSQRGSKAWPDRRQSRALLAAVPWRVMLGRAGFLPHVVVLLLLLPLLDRYQRLHVRLLEEPWRIAVTALAAAVVLALIGGVRKGEAVAIAALAALAGAGIAVLPVGVAVAVAAVPWTLPLGWLSDLLILVGAAFGGALLFGSYLTALTAFGLEHTQAFTTLGHPGFKHFLRLRLRRDGRTLDVWCIGREDPLGGQPPVLVDHFTWPSEGDPDRPRDGEA